MMDNKVKRLKLASQDIQHRHQRVVFLAAEVVMFGNFAQFVHLSAFCPVANEKPFTFIKCAKPKYCKTSFHDNQEAMNKLNLVHNSDTGMWESRFDGESFAQEEAFMLKNFLTFLRFCQGQTAEKLLLVSYSKFLDDVLARTLIFNLKLMGYSQAFTHYVDRFGEMLPFLRTKYPQVRSDVIGFVDVLKLIKQDHLLSGEQVFSGSVARAMSDILSASDVIEFKRQSKEFSCDIQQLFDGTSVEEVKPDPFSSAHLFKSWEVATSHVIQWPSQQEPREVASPEIPAKQDLIEVFDDDSSDQGDGSSDDRDSEEGPKCEFCYQDENAFEMCESCPTFDLRKKGTLRVGDVLKKYTISEIVFPEDWEEASLGVVKVAFIQNGELDTCFYSEVFRNCLLMSPTKHVENDGDKIGICQRAPNDYLSRCAPQCKARISLRAQENTTISAKKLVSIKIDSFHLPKECLLLEHVARITNITMGSLMVSNDYVALEEGQTMLQVGNNSTLDVEVAKGQIVGHAECCHNSENIVNIAKNFTLKSSPEKGLCPIVQQVAEFHPEAVKISDVEETVPTQPNPGIQYCTTCSEENIVRHGISDCNSCPKFKVTLTMYNDGFDTFLGLIDWENNQKVANRAKRVLLSLAYDHMVRKFMCLVIKKKYIVVCMKSMPSLNRFTQARGFVIGEKVGICQEVQNCDEKLLHQPCSRYRFYTLTTRRHTEGAFSVICSDIRDEEHICALYGHIQEFLMFDTTWKTRFSKAYYRVNVFGAQFPKTKTIGLGKCINENDLAEALLNGIAIPLKKVNLKEFPLPKRVSQIDKAPNIYAEGYLYPVLKSDLISDMPEEEELEFHQDHCDKTCRMSRVEELCSNCPQGMVIVVEDVAPQKGNPVSITCRLIFDQVVSNVNDVIVFPVLSHFSWIQKICKVRHIRGKFYCVFKKDNYDGLPAELARGSILAICQIKSYPEADAPTQDPGRTKTVTIKIAQFAFLRPNSNEIIRVVAENLETGKMFASCLSLCHGLSVVNPRYVPLSANSPSSITVTNRGPGNITFKKGEQIGVGEILDNVSPDLDDEFDVSDEESLKIIPDFGAKKYSLVFDGFMKSKTMIVTSQKTVTIWCSIEPKPPGDIDAFHVSEVTLRQTKKFKLSDHNVTLSLEKISLQIQNISPQVEKLERKSIIGDIYLVPYLKDNVKMSLIRLESKISTCVYHDRLFTATCKMPEWNFVENSQIVHIQGSDLNSGVSIQTDCTSFLTNCKQFSTMALNISGKCLSKNSIVYLGYAKAYVYK